jgi:hypothetical protein
MIPLSMVIELFQTFKNNSTSYNKMTKIFLSGDPAQLPPVEEPISSIFMKSE